jgi:hypothetical protein
VPDISILEKLKKWWGNDPQGWGYLDKRCHRCALNLRNNRGTIHFPGRSEVGKPGRIFQILRCKNKNAARDPYKVPCLRQIIEYLF